jgi:hypothetical protein
MGSPALAPPDVRDVTLSLFAGRKTDIAPSDLPEGLTPDEQDGIYVPGEWLSRPCLARLYAAGLLTPGTTVLYEKTYVQPNDDPLTLVLTSDGKLWVEDVGNNPENPTALSQLITPGLYAQSVTEFGREYIAFSDLLHGQGVPLQYDGTNLDRVTMDGPGKSPTVTDYQNILAISNIGPEVLGPTIANSPTGATFSGPLSGTVNTDSTGLQVTWVSGNEFTDALNGQIIIINNEAATVLLVTSATTLTLVNEVGTSASGAAYSAALPGVVTITTLTPHGFIPGEIVFISGVAVAGYNGLQTIDTVPSTTTFTFTTSQTGLANSGTGSVRLPVGSIEGNYTGAPSLNVADAIIVTGSGSGLDNDVAGNPATWPVISASFAAGTFQITFSYSLAPSTIVPVAETTGRVALGGQSSPGPHQVVCMWLTRQGALTAPSPPLTFLSVGNTQWAVSGLPIGPANVVARVLGFTGAGGDNFFTIPASVTLPNPTSPTGTPIIVGATVIPDNTSTSFIVDVPDNTLFAAVPIDQIGNDLFDQVVLGPVLGFYAFASRLSCWGDYNKIENFLGMGFEGGSIAGSPAGWTTDGSTAGGSISPGGAWAAGECWLINGDGLGIQGRLSQSAYQDAFGDAILTPTTQYTMQAWLSGNRGGGQPVIFEIYSPSGGGVLATVTLEAGATAGFVQGEFSAKTPAAIPADTVFRFYSSLSLGYTVEVDELSIIFTEDPYRDNESRWSYVENPEGFAQTTGNLGPEDDASPIRCFALLRSSSLLETAEGVHIFSDTTAEPDEWNVNQVTRAVGAASLRAGDPGKFGTGDASEDWALVAGKNGVYLFAGAEFWKVSQEISRGALPQAQDPRLTWDDITWAAEQTIVAKNDPALRRAYFAVPVNGALTPNKIAVLDYREMDTATQIAAAPPLHITIQGKMKSSDLTRKWSWWNVAANDMEILVRPGNQRQLFLAGGNGLAVGQGEGFGNIYSLDPANLTDDDYGAIAPYYTTYFFTDHDQEQALGIGSDIHLVRRIHAFITGVGLVTITPIVNSLYNFQPNLSQRILVGDTDPSNFLKSDLEWTTVGLRGNRIAFRIAVQPLPGSTDVQIRLQKFIVAMMKDPIAQFRQSGV